MTLLASGSAAAGHDDSPAAVAARLGGRLLEAWSDCGPAALAAAPELPPSQCMAALLACLNLLLPYFESTPGETEKVAILQLGVDRVHSRGSSRRQEPRSAVGACSLCQTHT